MIIATCGRQTLAATLQSIITQNPCPTELLVDINDDSPWGNVARQRQMMHATGTHIMFMDDDDTYAPGAFAVVRRELKAAPDRVHLFRMIRPGGLDDIWRTPVLEDGNVSTQMVVVPNAPGKLGQWGGRYQGDYDFIAETCALQGEPVWHEDTIAIYGGEHGQ